MIQSLPAITDTRRISRLISAIENHPESVRALLAHAFRKSGRAHTVGMTGSPGVGKSTLTNAFIHELRRHHKSVAVIAADPTSPYTGGAVLGDRIRMSGHHQDPCVYIRSMASRGALGGLAGSTQEVVYLLDAVGFDYILLETLGVGQDEIEIARLADTCVLILAPGMGDIVQALKAGIMEIGHIFSVNKSDLHGVARVVDDIRASLAVRKAGPNAWSPPVCETCGTRPNGIETLYRHVLAHRRFLEARAPSDDRIHRLKSRLCAILRKRLHETVEAVLDRKLSRKILQDLDDRKTDPYTILEWLCKEDDAGNLMKLGNSRRAERT